MTPPPLGRENSLLYFFSCEAQLNTCTFLLSVCPWSNLNFSLFGQLMTAYDNLWQLMTAYASLWQLWQLMTTFDNFWQLLTTFDNFWQLLTTFDNFWQLLTTYDNLWQPMTTYDNLWQLMTTYDNLWQLMTTFDNFWLWCFVQGVPKKTQFSVWRAIEVQTSYGGLKVSEFNQESISEV